MTEMLKCCMENIIHYKNQYNDCKTWFRIMFVRLEILCCTTFMVQCDPELKLENITAKFKRAEYIINTYMYDLFDFEMIVETYQNEILGNTYHKSKSNNEFEKACYNIRRFCDDRGAGTAIYHNIKKIKSILYGFKKKPGKSYNDIFLIVVEIKKLFKQLESMHDQVYNELDNIIIDDSIEHNLYRLDQIFGLKKDCEYMELMDVNVIYKVICDFIN